MLRPLIFLLFSFLLKDVSAQKRQAVELTLLGRYDKHADYVSNYGGRVQQDTMQLYGISYGFALQYRRLLRNGFSIALGTGYYRLGITKINTTQRPFPGIGHSRPLQYTDRSAPFQPSLLYHTPAYHYNTVSLSLGVEKNVPLPQNLFLDVSAMVTRYYTFSQGYQVPHQNEMFPTWNKRWLGTGVNAGLGLSRSFNKFYIKPALVLPVYQQLKSDEVFEEDPRLRLNKWFGGVGLAFTVGKYLD